MNKMIYLCAAAALTLASCSNDETVEVAQQKGISFRAVTGLNTRASEVTTANLSEIQVTAFWDANNNKYDGFTNGEVLYKRTAMAILIPPFLYTGQEKTRKMRS